MTTRVFNEGEFPVSKSSCSLISVTFDSPDSRAPPTSFADVKWPAVLLLISRTRTVTNMDKGSCCSLCLSVIVYNRRFPANKSQLAPIMSSAAYSVPAEPRNVLETCVLSCRTYGLHGLTNLYRAHIMLATENVSVTQLWATTLVPTTASFSAAVALIAPQHVGNFRA